MYIHILTWLIRSSKLFRNYVCYENLNKSFCLVLKVFNKVINCIVLILINIYLFSCININTIYCVWCSVFGSHQSFEEKILLQICLQYTLHIWVIQRKLRLIIYSILYVYSHMSVYEWIDVNCLENSREMWIIMNYLFWYQLMLMKYEGI